VSILVISKWDIISLAESRAGSFDKAIAIVGNHLSHQNCPKIAQEKRLKQL
jgi:hypothetical protein